MENALPTGDFEYDNEAFAWQFLDLWESITKLD